MKAHLFLARSNGEAPPSTPPQDDPAWIFASVGKTLKTVSEPSYAEKLLRAHRIAAEVRQRRGMGVRFKNCRMAEWTAE